MKKNKLYYMICFVWLISCDDFLDSRPNKDIVTPTTLEDLRAILDNTRVMNHTTSLHLISTDDLITTEAGLLSFSFQEERNSYLWKEELVDGFFLSDWDNTYKVVFGANLVLEELQKFDLTESGNQLTKELRGEALFFRAFANYQLMQMFAPHYDITTAETDLGVPLKESVDIYENTPRSSVKDCYDHIINDLNQAIPLLNESSTYFTRPTRKAANLFLARIHLLLNEFLKAKLITDELIQDGLMLLDYNELNANLNNPIPLFNREVIFHSQPYNFSFMLFPTVFVDPNLYGKFDENDLRRNVFFRDRGNGNFTFKGNYSGGLNFFSGLASDEAYLINSEACARLGDTQIAIERLNELLVSRYQTGTFVPYDSVNLPEQEVLDLILEERRKQLINRSLRWSDLRRLNKEPKTAKTLTRNLNGEIYTLEPNDKRYVFPIPQSELDYNPIPQNIRG